MKQEDKFVYYDNQDYRYIEITKEYVDDAQKLREDYLYDESCYDENNEVTIYKLVPLKKLKKEISYKFVE